MGCSNSKLGNEDTVRRCKERRRLMKEAVCARNHLSSAHAEYCRSLRATGAALVTFASGEPLMVSHHAPAVFLRADSSASAKAPPLKKTFIPPPPPRHHIPSISPSPSPPPPPPPAAAMSTASSRSFHRHQPPAPPPPNRRNKGVKLPHILSDSSFSSSPPPNLRYIAREHSTYSSTPSQASSVWNWDNFCPPPSPPDSEYFQNLHESKKKTDSHSEFGNYTDFENDDRASSLRSYPNSQILPHRSNNLNQFARKPSRWESDEEEEAEREEVQCSEWGDHDHRYSCTTSSSDDDEREELKSRSEFDSRSNRGTGMDDSAFSPPADERMPPPNKDSKFFAKPPSHHEDDDGNSNSERANPDRRIVVRHKDLSEIVAAIKEFFDKAASSGDQVSEMLETGKAQFDRSFKQLKKTVYHSNGMLSNLSSSWTSKPPLAVKYRFDPSSLDQPGSAKSLCSTLERLLAWEKKLYEEVKAREGVKIEHEKKLSSLQSQEYRGDDEAKMDKTKASIKKLQSLIVVTSQAVSTTSSAIVDLRDSDLVPQLVELCHGFMYMWRSMNRFHESQNDIVQQVRGLVNGHANRGGESTSDLHRRATSYLESAVSEWHSSFCRLIKFQRDFIRSLHGWFKLTVLPVNSEQMMTMNSNGREVQLGEVFGFIDEWKLALDRVPDTVASEAIKSFINVVHSISAKQAEELKIRKRTESVSKELERKASSLRSIEKKYYLSYSTVGIGLPDPGPDHDGGHALDARDPLAEKKAELATCQRRVEEEMVRHSKAVEVTRAMTLNNLQTGLPGVFQAMTGFSGLITEALQAVCNRSYAI
ncbi:hypothetical protein M569_06016 [Genlisea aurea]|uniref:DUF632 domain-containing protein n=1 Tax=Genlisea aurea TaxID=192259 RepID=S8CV26_9LAMI|nr:hypothetical protein M569_06016 [Genlisea aurea]